MEREGTTIHTPAEGVRIIGADSADPNAPVKPPVDIDLTELESDTSPGNLPHWTEPATGQVPAVLAAVDAPSAEDELSSGPIWRDDHTGWEDKAVDQLTEDLTPATPVVSSTPTRSRTAEQERAVTISSSSRTPGRTPFDGERISAEVIMNTRIVTGAALALIALVAFPLGPAALVFVAALAVALSTMELYTALRHIGLKPAIPVGIVSVLSLMFGAYARGESAIPVVLGLSVIATLVWFLTGASAGRPSVSSAATLLGTLYPGLLMAFAALMLRAPQHRGVALLFGCVVTTVAYDTAAFFVGRQVGQRKLLEHVSPSKTIEGAAGGTAAAFVVAFILVAMMNPWTHANTLWLALIVSVMAPLGDLCESLIKRDLGLKDMGGLLPGHGGMLDRIDALLFVIPAVYALAQVTHLI